jgi:hypothetical protein
LIQCSIPVFYGLLPEKQEDEDSILEMLHCILEWQMLAGMDLHTEITLEQFKSTHRELGIHLRNFTDCVCTHFGTVNLTRDATRSNQQAESLFKSASVRHVDTKTSASSKWVAYNLARPKIHMLGYYASTIERLGVTLNTNSEQVCIIGTCS